MELLTSHQMRALEQSAINSGRATGRALMEAAGQGGVQAVLDHVPDFSDGAYHALVLCGPGNNGGDGFVIARLLARLGWTVSVYLFGDPARLPDDAKANHDRWAETHPVHRWSAPAIFSDRRPDVIFDAVFGLGLTRALPADVADVLCVQTPKRWAQAGPVYRVAVDCPSGLSLDTGYMVANERGSATTGHDMPNRADLTVTFHCPKPGHFLGDGPELCTKLHVVDIGLKDTPLRGSSHGIPTNLAPARLVGRRPDAVPAPEGLHRAGWPVSLLPKSGGWGHKFTHGHVQVFAGGVGRGGAGRLAARAALRCGAGVVTLICPKAALIENAMHLNAIMLRGLDDPSDLEVVADARVSAFCLGPGLGIGARTKALVGAVLRRGVVPAKHRRPAVVLDADALTSFAEDPADLFAQLHDRSVLTPHAGEFERLFPDIAALEETSSKIERVRKAAARAGCIVLLKGPDTVIAAPNGRVALHAASYERAAPWLATAGAGDVLAGLIAGLAASSASAELFEMVEVAVWLHVEAARHFGPGLIAEDLPEMLPDVFRSLGL